MSKSLLIGIDLGTTALKVAAYDQHTGKRVAGADVPLGILTGSDGRREQQPETILKALRKALVRIAPQIGGLDRVRGVGLASQGGSGIVADRTSGQARSPMTLWNDARAFPQFQRLLERFPARYWRTRTRRDEPGMGLARLERLRDETPGLLCDDNLYAGAGDYTYFHLTGAWRQDACHALQTGIYDARKNALSRELAALVGLSVDFFPGLRLGHQTHPLSDAAARRFGLPVGIPVAGPYMDHEAGFLSAAQVSSRPLQCSLGTAWVGNFQRPLQCAGHTPFQLAIPSPATEGTLVIQPLLTGNVTWDWALKTFVAANAALALKKQVGILGDALLPPEGLTAIPWLNRPHPLNPALLGGCTFSGLGPTTTPHDLLRAVVAGMGYELHRVFEDVARTGVIDSIVLSGGASRSPYFQQVIAALFDGLPAYLLEDGAWMGTRGCLYAFSLEVSQARATPIAPKEMFDPGALEAGRSLYHDVFTRLYSHVRAGSAYTLGNL